MKKNSSKILKFIIIMIIFILLSCNIIVHADPGSSKGFAEYSDSVAEEESMKLEEEQIQNSNIIEEEVNKINNENYKNEQEHENTSKKDLNVNFENEIQEKTIGEKNDNNNMTKNIIVIAFVCLITIIIVLIIYILRRSERK